MADKFPVDEFDAAPQHGGRHRIRRTARHRVAEFVKIVAISAGVALLGYGGLKAIDSLNFFDGNVVANPVVEDQSRPIVVVLDGTTTKGLASKWAVKLANNYNVSTAANYLQSSGGQVAATTVYYAQSADAATAAAIAKTITTKTGKAVVTASTDFPDAITVVLGTDVK